MKLMDARTVRSIDRAAIRRYGIKGLVLMENAGRGVAEAVKRELASSGGARKRVVIIAGKGNNGGDGFVAARHLKNSGIDSTVVSLARVDSLKGDALVNARAWVKMGGEVVVARGLADLKRRSSLFTHSSLIVDAIFGTGLTKPVEGRYSGVIDLINSLGKKVVSVDVPSGIDATTGAVLGTAVRADVTVTMAAPKLGLYLYPGREHSGRIEVADIGCPKELIEDPGIRWELSTAEHLKKILRPRGAASHKGSHGHLLVAAGSPGMTGAAYMAGMGALRAGAGLVTVGVPESLRAALDRKTVEVMTLALPEGPDKTLVEASFERLKEALKGKTALVIGPGFVPSEEARALVEMVVREIKIPLLVDGGALSALAGRASVLKRSKAPVVITPHPGEAARLLGVTPADVQADRIASAERLVRATGATVVLKGASTVVASHGRVFVNPTGNPALSTAGTGDVLAGMIGGFLAQGYGALDSAVSVVYLHGLAADIISERGKGRGMVASDLLGAVPAAFESVLARSREA